MADFLPLQIASKTVGSMIDNEWKTDAWPALSYLYAGAVLQMKETNPRDISYVDSFKTIDLMTEATRNLEAHGIIKNAVEEILAETKSQQLSNMARHVVQSLGYPVFSKICFEIESNPDVAEGVISHHCIEGEMGGFRFRLIPSFHGGGNHLTEPLKHRMTEHLPEDGWMSGPTKILPRFVRVLTGDIMDKSNIHYLEIESRTTNRTLAMQYGEQGLSLAALPLCRDLVMPWEKRGESKDGIKFRIIEPKFEKWPSDWKEHLHLALDKCQEKRVAIAVLPELIGSPTVLSECEKYIVGKKFNFPTLLVGGSWHTGNGDNFYNRMSIYSCSGNDGLIKICSHDKFAQFNDKGFIEDSLLGNGYTFIVTSIGIFALGICRDWFFDAQTDPSLSIKLLSQAVPAIAIAPAMTSSAEEIKEHVDRFHRYGHTAMIFSNACGQTRSMNGGNCCGAKLEKDARSFVAAPASYFDVYSLCGTEPSQGGVEYVRAPCRENKTGDNTVIAGIRLLTAEEMEEKSQNKEKLDTDATS